MLIASWALTLAMFLTGAAAVLAGARWRQALALLDSLRFEINRAEVYVFTPRGDVVALPAGSTPVDFAYSVHTEVGHTTIGARVNGRLVSLESKLENGDVVEVFTSKAPGAGPSRDWLDFVKSPRARNKIKQWFTKERRDEAVERGKDALTDQVELHQVPGRQGRQGQARDVGDGGQGPAPLGRDLALRGAR
mgnify:CR=1 FL=1